MFLSAGGVMKETQLDGSKCQVYYLVINLTQV